MRRRTLAAQRVRGTASNTAPPTATSINRPTLCAPIAAAAARFDKFIEVCNNKRPHEALDMKCPAEVYQPSPRPYTGLPDIDYPWHDKTIVVTRCRRICLGSKKINFSTVREEFSAVAFRKTFCESLEQLRRDHDEYLAFYNRERTHQGYRTQGHTPFQAFSEGLEQMRREEVNPEAA